MRAIIFVVFSLLSLPTVANTLALSASRAPTETYEDARARSFAQNHHPTPFSTATAAESVKVPLEQVRIESIPPVESYEAMLEQFFYVRDTRFIETANEDFPRRLTWLYPDDGCYARAEMAKIKLVNSGFVTPKKMFVFGNLRANTPNSRTGVVRWWYHVAVTYRVGNVAYIFDPAINPLQPLTLQEWHVAVGGERSQLRYSLCAADTFDPRANCTRPQSLPADAVEGEQARFLDPEWQRILSLGRSPENELGENPPWLAPQIL